MEKSQADFLRTPLSYGIILRADISEIDEIKKFIAGITGVKIVYQTVREGHLWIVAKNGEEQPGGGHGR